MASILCHLKKYKFNSDTNKSIEDCSSFTILFFIYKEPAEWKTGNTNLIDLYK